MTLGWAAPSEPATTMLLLRHGDTRLSPEHRFAGLRDVPLSAEGARQAKAAAIRLASTGSKIDAVVSSPLRRAADTAAIAAAELGLSVADTDDDLRETDFGDWEGRTLAEVQESWPAAVAAWQHDPEQAPPGGESFACTARRVDQARDRLLRDLRGGNDPGGKPRHPDKDPAMPRPRRAADHPLPDVSRLRLHQRDPMARP